MAYMKKALSLIQVGDSVHFIKPWWEVVEQFSIDAMMLLSVTSVTADLFQGSGALQCVAANKTIDYNPPQMYFVNQECTEQWPLYAKYFPYFLFFQVILFVIVNNLWTGVCRDQIQDFGNLVERCSKTPVRRKNVKKLMEYMDERKSGRECKLSRGWGEPEEPKSEHVIEALSLKEKMDVKEAEQAMTLCEEVVSMSNLLETSVHSSVTYYIKSFASLCLVVGVFILGVAHLAASDFDFFFACHLPAASHDHLLDAEDYVCVNKTTTLSKWLQIVFLIEVGIFAIADIYGILGWCRVMLNCCGCEKTTTTTTTTTKKTKSTDDDVFDDVVTLGAGAPAGNDLPLLRKDEQVTFLSGNIRRKKGSDTGFMLYLLRETDKDIAENFCHFMDPGFHEELEALVTNQRWPLSALKDRLKQGEHAGEKTLSLADQDLLCLPNSLALTQIGGDHLVELDLSFNKNLDDLSPLSSLRHLKTLKCSRCGVVSLQPLVHLEDLNFLDVSDNEIVDIPVEIRRLLNLKCLWIDGNPLEALNEAALTLASLKEVRVDARMMAGISAGVAKTFRSSDLHPNMFERVGRLSNDDDGNVDRNQDSDQSESLRLRLRATKPNEEFKDENATIDDETKQKTT